MKTPSCSHSWAETFSAVRRHCASEPPGARCRSGQDIRPNKVNQMAGQGNRQGGRQVVLRPERQDERLLRDIVENADKARAGGHAHGKTRRHQQERRFDGRGLRRNALRMKIAATEQAQSASDRPTAPAATPGESSGRMPAISSRQRSMSFSAGPRRSSPAGNAAGARIAFQPDRDEQARDAARAQDAENHPDRAQCGLRSRNGSSTISSTTTVPTSRSRSMTAEAATARIGLRVRCAIAITRAASPSAGQDIGKQVADPCDQNASMRWPRARSSTIHRADRSTIERARRQRRREPSRAHPGQVLAQLRDFHRPQRQPDAQRADAMPSQNFQERTADFMV